ncbi:MAG: polysaccharide deacetylase family protein [Planctomycetota bacterium]|nr:polysaccharide deacetylase family protein [Planctomycetota bacterium]
MAPQDTSSGFWPAGKRAALSLSFDDARWSQTANGFPLLAARGVKATFYVSLQALEQKLEAWRRAVADGHEIGNHSVTHPCSGNFAFARRNPLEDYTLERMEKDELLAANAAIHRLLGVRPLTFAYPCGQTFVGRGENLKSYVPLVARHFLAGRGFMGESANDPTFCDLAQATALCCDSIGFDQMKTWLDHAAEQGEWLILAGHDIGPGGRQTTLAADLDKLCAHAMDPANGIWVDTVAAVAKYIKERR